MTQVLPTVGKLVQATADGFPIALTRKFWHTSFAPFIDFSQQIQTLSAVDDIFGFDFFNPSFHHHVGCVASVVKTLPQGVVGRTALVGLLPLVAHGSQGFLHFASTQGLAVWALQQALSLNQQFLTNLIRTPALPAFQLAGCRQCGVGLVFKLVVNQFAVLLEGITQSIGCSGAGFTVAFSHFLL